MNCYLHPETPAAAFCRSCGRPLCGVCQRPANGTIYCEEHFPQPANAANPYSQPSGVPLAVPIVQTSPGLAFTLGLIPGVGAIYNGQYLKGLIHAVIFGLLVSLMASIEHDAGRPLIGICLMAFYFYMPFEAFHTAKRRRMGLPVDEFSSMVAPGRFALRTPIGPIFLIAIGVLFLLDTLDLVHFRDLARFWPILLILGGAFMLYNRMSGGATPLPTPVEPMPQEYVEPRS